MKIIKMGRAAKRRMYQVQCSRCQTIFEFGEDESVLYSHSLGAYLSVYCPNCKGSCTKNPEDWEGKDEPEMPLEPYMDNPPHPMQPLVYDCEGVIRFKKNKIVRHLLDNGGLDLNKLCVQCHEDSQEDWEQFYQLIGYSVSGYGDLSRVRPESVNEADEQSEVLRQQKMVAK